MVPTLARPLGGCVESLLGEKPGPAKCGPVPKLQQQIEPTSQLPRTQQQFVIRMIASVMPLITAEDEQYKAILGFLLAM